MWYLFCVLSFGMLLGNGPISGMQFLIFTAAVGKLIACAKIWISILGIKPDCTDTQRNCLLRNQKPLELQDCEGFQKITQSSPALRWDQMLPDHPGTHTSQLTKNLPWGKLLWPTSQSVLVSHQNKCSNMTTLHLKVRLDDPYGSHPTQNILW